jgi:hypothetical protein
VQGPKFKPQYCQKKDERKKWCPRKGGELVTDIILTKHGQQVGAMKGKN